MLLGFLGNACLVRETGRDPEVRLGAGQLVRVTSQAMGMCAANMAHTQGQGDHGEVEVERA